VIFPTVEFTVFFAVILPLSWALMSRPRGWKPAMLAASYVFYAAADFRFCLLLAAITFGCHVSAKLIAASDDDRRR
jgi:D-alanyl-lipoteichoic acid acyltransferase DltB (MBOAT superfamily)